MPDKRIETLVEDIYRLFDEPHKVNTENADALGKELAAVITRRLEEETGAEPPRLRMSNLGVDCERKLWYYINTPGRAEPLPPEARIKFLFGDILEQLLLFLAREAGHKVEGVQDELEINGTLGHRDAVVDGVTVDCKSASSQSFRKFKDGTWRSDDPFGYGTQLDIYRYAGRDDPRVVEKDRAAILAIDKTLGHVTLTQQTAIRDDWEREVERKREVINLPNPPTRPYLPVPDGKSGNLRLGVACSYCPFKFPCWERVRTFVYANGPKYLVKVVREPDVPEVT